MLRTVPNTNCLSLGSSNASGFSAPEGFSLRPQAPYLDLMTLRHQNGTSLKRNTRLDVLPIRAIATNSIKGGGGASGGKPVPQIKVRAIVTINRKHHPDYKESIFNYWDSYSDMVGRKVILQLVSTEIDPRTNVGKRSREAELKDWAEKARYAADKVEYIAEFIVSGDFGLPGAITIVNEHPHELHIETIALEGFPSGRIYFPCYTWVHSRRDNPEKRVLFSNEVYLPAKTPEGLKDLREREKMSLRGNGQGTRKYCDRIYEYAAYNDLGNPDRHKAFARPTFGQNEEFPYPRRCRTGRPPTKSDLLSESTLDRRKTYYVPRDETFEEMKQAGFIAGSLKVIMLDLLPNLLKNIKFVNHEFRDFTEIDRLFNEGMILNELAFPTEFLNRFWVPKFMNQLENSIGLHYSQPQLVSKDRFSWLRDDEMGRQVLAGVNPLQIECLKSFPPVSNLDPNIYGARESALKAEHIERQLGGLTLEKAMEQEKLFIVDYHDVFMPFINKINALENRKMYASRMLLYLNTNGTLTPVAIELSLPPPSPGSQVHRRVFTPGQDATSHWFWQLAKAHAVCNDAGFHQLVNHWLRSHASVEPYIIATHRQLSFIHPIAKLLHPHLRYTLEINALARQLLIDADGVIERCFTPGPYSMAISSSAYKLLWRFDMENLPADLIKRGMAVEDSGSPFGLKLLIEDYPYAADGILIWDAIQTWVNEYVSIYYSNPEDLDSDQEIHGWWEEIKQQGHGDKKNEKWWPKLKTKEDLAGILTSIIWVTSCHHAAVNFGQYAYGGYVPNRPCMTRRLIPEADETSKDFQEFLHEPQKFFLSTIPNRIQATMLMAVLDSLSTHAEDEEYLGQRVHTNWTADAKAKAVSLAFEKKIKEIERVIDSRNADANLKNRNGAGVLPYELLRPTSGPGTTGRGIPNSISI